MTAGVAVQTGSGNVIGGTAAGTGNVISGNSQGVFFLSGASGNLVQGNFIGTDASGARALSNNGAGIYLRTGSSNSSVGGLDPAAANRIAYNLGHGVLVGGSSTGNAILGNAIYCNNGLGICLSSGANGSPAAPQLSAAQLSSGSLSVTWSLAAGPNTNYYLEFFASASGEEGERFLGSVTVTTDAAGGAGGTAVFTAPVELGETATATASSPAMAPTNTSAFSAPVPVQSGG